MKKKIASLIITGLIITGLGLTSNQVNPVQNPRENQVIELRTTGADRPDPWSLDVATGDRPDPWSFRYINM